MKFSYITQAEYDFLQSRLSKLEDSNEVALKDLKHALNYGSETWHDNDMYDTAKSKQINIDIEKKEIQRILKSTKILDRKDVDLTKASIGTCVTIENTDNGEILTIKIGGREATRLGEEWVSLDSPLGRAISGKKPNTTISLDAPGTNIQYKILNIKIA